MRRFEFLSDGSNKFWSVMTEVTSKGGILRVTFGKIGDPGTNQIKMFKTGALADAEAEKRIKEKLAKGYVEVKKGARRAKPAALGPSCLVRKGHPELDAQIAKLRKDITKAGLGERSAEIEQLTRWTVRMLTKPTKKTPVGASRIGGWPDLPPEMKWPTHDKRMLVFAAQVRLEDAAPFDVDHLLPKRGLLSIFLDGQYDAVSVHHFESVAGLERRVVDKTEEMWNVPDHPCAVTFRTEYCLPPSIGPTIETLNLDQDESDRYTDDVHLDHVPGDRDPHRLLGYPGWSWNYEQKKTIELLAQIGSDDKAGMQWGDAQPLFVYIPKAALAARNFKKAFLATDG